MLKNIFGLAATAALIALAVPTDAFAAKSRGQCAIELCGQNFCPAGYGGHNVPAWLDKCQGKSASARPARVTPVNQGQRVRGRP